MTMNTQSRIEVIRDYVDLQTSLIKAVTSGFDESIDDLNFKKAVPEKVTADGRTWNVRPHGVGIRFECPSTGEVVDAHVGFLDAPDSFDAWRLEEYCDSQGIAFSSCSSWKEELVTLESEGHLLTHERAHHFTLLIVENTTSRIIKGEQ